MPSPRQRARIAGTSARRALLRWRARLFALGLVLRRAEVTIGADVLRLAAANREAQGGLTAPTILLSFHGPGLYGLVRCIHLFDVPVIVLGTRAAVRVMAAARRLGVLPHGIVFKQRLAAGDVARIGARKAVLFVFCDTTLSTEAMFHVVLGDRVRHFSGAWAALASRIGARIVCLRSLKRGRQVHVDHREIAAGATPFAAVTAAFDFLFDDALQPGDWDFAISDWLYPQVQPLSGASEPRAFVDYCAASHPELTAMLRAADS